MTDAGLTKTDAGLTPRTHEILVRRGIEAKLASNKAEEQRQELALRKALAAFATTGGLNAREVVAILTRPGQHAMTEADAQELIGGLPKDPQGNIPVNAFASAMAGTATLGLPDASTASARTGGLDPEAVLRELPDNVQAALRQRDSVKFRTALQEMPADDAAALLDRCIGAGLWRVAST